jgi:predicted acetyltransferase
MITYAEEEQKKDVENLWKISFPYDTEEFINLYFKEKYKKENTLVYIEENKVVSCLQMLPYHITYYNHICKTSYISGAATLPEYKNRGFMGKLISESFLEMKKRGDLFSVLIPQIHKLTKFYQKYGYVSCFEYTIYPVLLPHKLPITDRLSIVEMDAVNMREAYVFYNERCNKRNLSVLKTFHDFRIIWEDLKLAAGSILLCYEADQICGICFCFDLGEKMIIKDLIISHKAVGKYLSNYVVKQYPEKRVYLSKPAPVRKRAQHCITRGMARILNAPKALQLYALSHTDMEITIKVNDYQIAENNGVFLLSNGICTQKRAGNFGLFDLEVDINMLTRLLFGFQTDKLSPEYHIFPLQDPYISLMLD